MSNLIFNRDSTLPSYELTTAQNGEIIGVKVKRYSHSVYYHRTGRGPKEMIDHPDGELHQLFESTKSFSKFVDNKIVLDLGCGDGRLVTAMSEMNTPILGLDLHLSSEQTKELVFFKGDAFRMPFQSETFDCVISTWSVFHYEPFHQLAPLLREVLRAMRRDATLIIPSIFNIDRLRELKIIARKLAIEVSLIQPTNILICRKL